VPISEDHVRQMAALAGIAITPGQMPGVIGNLAILLEEAALLFDPPVDVLLEPAPVFCP